MPFEEVCYDLPGWTSLPDPLSDLFTCQDKRASCVRHLIILIAENYVLHTEEGAHKK